MKSIRNKSLSLSLTMFLVICCFPLLAIDVSVTDFGALGGDGETDTRGFQEAIDQCHGKGGGIVLVPEGVYFIGTVELKSHVTLNLGEGALVFGSHRREDYREDTEVAVEIPSGSSCLLYANNAEHIGISGEGTIDGRGTRDVFPMKGEGGRMRPMLIRLIKSRHIHVQQVHLKDAASWLFHLVECEEVEIHDITLRNRVNTNNDGIDIDDCRNVSIYNCDIIAHDDAICMKSTTGGINENIRIHNCRISSNWGCFKTGTSSRGGFKNIEVKYCEFYDCPGIAIKLLCVDGGLMEGINISDILMKNVTGPIFIRLGGRNRDYKEAAEQVFNRNLAEGEGKSRIRDIQIYNISAEVATDDLSRSNIMITGYPDHYVENVLLKNINIQYPGGGTREHAALVVEEQAALYPEMHFFGILPSSGIYLRHVKGLSIKDCNISYQSDDKRPVIVAEDLRDAQIAGLKISGIPQADILFKVSDSESVTFSDIEFEGEAKTILSADKLSKRIQVK